MPAGVQARDVRLLTAGIVPVVERNGSEIALTVPSIDVHEVVAIDI
jgi:hypothetical protein